MQDALAERLLAEVMGWGQAEVAANRPILQALAAYKYDEYQQFSPGMRFVESLALWLRQFKTKQERQDAFDFVRKRLVFFSGAEIAHFVSIAYPDLIRPILIRKAAEKLGISPLKIGAVTSSNIFKVLLRQSLFLALSDGARTDVFRRANPQISHEQVWHAYDMSPAKADSMIKKLHSDLEVLLGRKPTDEEGRFKFVCLLDDFSGSGKSYLRKEANGEFDGKIARVLADITQRDRSLNRAADSTDCFICTIIYMAAQQAIDHLTPLAEELFGSKSRWSIDVVQALPNIMKVGPSGDKAFVEIIETDSYYDPGVEDENTRIGGDGVRFGFAHCSLPVVLHHNTPNNSVFLLWGSPNVRGLFPRVSRHHNLA